MVAPASRRLFCAAMEAHKSPAGRWRHQTPPLPLHFIQGKRGGLRCDVPLGLPATHLSRHRPKLGQYPPAAVGEC
jgi:hypothetical protein